MKKFILVILMISSLFASYDTTIEDEPIPFTIGFDAGLKYIQNRPHLNLRERAVIDGEMEQSLTITTLNDALKLYWLFESYIINVGNHLDFVIAWNAALYNPVGDDYVNWYAYNELGPLGIKPYIKTDTMMLSSTFMLWHTIYNKQQEFVISIKPRISLATDNDKNNIYFDVFYFYKYYPTFLKIEEHSFQMSIKYKDYSPLMYGLICGATFKKGPTIDDYIEYYLSISLTIDKTKGKKLGRTFYRY